MNSIGDFITSICSFQLGPLSLGIWAILVFAAYHFAPPILKMIGIRVKPPKLKKNAYLLFAFFFLALPALGTPIFTFGAVGTSPILKEIPGVGPWLYGVIAPPSGGTLPPPGEWILTGKIDISVSDKLGGVTADMDGSAYLYSGAPGALVPLETVTVTNGVGQSSINTYKSGDIFYMKVVVGSQTKWFGPITLPKQPQGSQATTHAVAVSLAQIDASGFSVTCNYKGTAISSYGSHNGTTTSDDYPMLNFGLYETTANKGFEQYQDFEKNWWREMIVVVRLNNTGADNVIITSYPAGWTLTRSSTDDRYYVFKPGDHLWLWKNSAGEVIDPGSLPFSLGFDISGVTAGQSVRVGIDLIINSNFDYYKTNNANPTGYTTVKSFVVYLKA